MTRLIVGARNAACLCVVAAMEETGLAYELASLDANALEHWSRMHRGFSPSGAFPLLVEDGAVLENSDLILAFLAERYPGANLGFADPVLDYRCRHLIAEMDHLLLDSGDLIGWLQTTPSRDRVDYLKRLEATPGRPKLTGWLAVVRDAVPPAERPADAFDALRQGIAAIAVRLADNDWLIGDRYSIADIACFALVQALPSLMPPGEGPQAAVSVADWMGRVRARPAVARAIERLEQESLLPQFAPPRYPD